MPSHSLRKVSKTIKQKKSHKSNSGIHENSRDSQRLRRAAAREDKIAKLSSNRSKKNEPTLHRIDFFQDKARAKKQPLTVDETSAAIAEYLQRFDEELHELKGSRRAGRPASTREDIINHQRALEEKEAASGFWMPNMQDEPTIFKLIEWTGEWSALGSMDFCRVSQSGTIKPSKFPPDGRS